MENYNSIIENYFLIFSIRFDQYLLDREEKQKEEN